MAQNILFVVVMAFVLSCTPSSGTVNGEEFMLSGEQPPAPSTLHVTGTLPKGWTMDAQIQVVATKWTDAKGAVDLKCADANRAGEARDVSPKTALIHQPVAVANAKFAVDLKPGKTLVVPGAEKFEDVELPTCAPVESNVRLVLQGMHKGAQVTATVLGLGHDPKLPLAPVHLDVACDYQPAQSKAASDALVCHPTKGLSQALMFRRSSTQLSLNITVGNAASALDGPKLTP